MTIRLTPGEKLNPLWGKLLQHFKEQRDNLRAKNDGDLDATTTAALRGSIKTYTALIDLDKDYPQQ